MGYIGLSHAAAQQAVLAWVGLESRLRNQDLAIFAGVVLLYFLSHYAMSRWILCNWAKREGLKILKASYCAFGPAGFRPYNHRQYVYAVTVRNAQGLIRKGWVRCGSDELGILVGEAQVCWEDEMRLRSPWF